MKKFYKNNKAFKKCFIILLNALMWIQVWKKYTFKKKIKVNIFGSLMFFFFFFFQNNVLRCLTGVLSLKQISWTINPSNSKKTSKRILDTIIYIFVLYVNLFFFYVHLFFILNNTYDLISVPLNGKTDVIYRIFFWLTPMFYFSFYETPSSN